MSEHASHKPAGGRPARPAPEAPDIREKGKSPEGETIYSDRRLFFQMQAYGNCHDIDAVKAALEASTVTAALYEDVNDPNGIAVMAYSEHDSFFVSELRELLSSEPFSSLTHKPEYTMMGRTYAIGYESDLEETLIHRSAKRMQDPNLDWVVWYPLKRFGKFNRLELSEQRKILGEHGTIGRAFGSADFGQDIRLACMGLDKNDNDFLIGLVGKELFPLSALVQTMRPTIQTSEYIEKMGPFFVGHKVWAR